MPPVCRVSVSGAVVVQDAMPTPSFKLPSATGSLSLPAKVLWNLAPLKALSPLCPGQCRQAGPGDWQSPHSSSLDFSGENSEVIQELPYSGDFMDFPWSQFSPGTIQVFLEGSDSVQELTQGPRLLSPCGPATSALGPQVALHALQSAKSSSEVCPCEGWPFFRLHLTPSNHVSLSQNLRLTGAQSLLVSPTQGLNHGWQVPQPLYPRGKREPSAKSFWGFLKGFRVRVQGPLPQGMRRR